MSMKSTADKTIVVFLQTATNLCWKSVLVAVLVAACAELSGLSQQQPSSTGSAGNDATSWSIVASGPNSRVWEASPPGPGGAVQHYTEIQPGLYYQSGGQWVESSETIVATADGAAATNGQIKVFWQGNLNTADAVDLTMPDGRHLRSNVLGIGYTDASGQSATIGEIQDCSGEILPGGQALYQDAFTGISADVLYQYGKGSFQQIVVFREQLPSPEAFGLDPETALLSLWTEYLSPPNPSVLTGQTDAGLDELIDWGSMQMIEGEAFALGTPTNRVPVTKRWITTADQRTVLVEQMPFQNLQPLLQELPPPSGGSARLRSPAHPSSKFKLPPRRLARKRLGGMKVASAAPPGLGVADDYELVSTVSNIVFQADETYYIDSIVSLTGQVVYEGGTVIKFSTNSQVRLTSDSSPVFAGSSYRPILMTAQDDNTEGQTLPFSTGSPSGYYAGRALFFFGATPPPFDHVRISYAKWAIQSVGDPVTVSDFQIVNCQQAFVGAGTLSMLNGLFSGNATNLEITSALAATVENCTFSQSACWALDTASATLDCTNCIFSEMTNLVAGSGTTTLAGANNAFYACTNFGNQAISLGSVYPFQTVGAGDYYISAAASSSLRSAGTTNIAASLLADLANCTTYPPLIYSNYWLTVPMTLGPQAGRDNGGSAVDIGYHYMSLDYLFEGIVISNTALTIAPGVGIGFIKGFGSNGVAFDGGGQFTSQGTATAPDWMVAYNMVQEQPGPNMAQLQYGLISDREFSISGPASVDCQFTDWSAPAQDTFHISCWYLPVTLAECEAHGGYLDFEYAFGLTNCLCDRVHTFLAQTPTNAMAVGNCLFHYGTVEAGGLLTNAIVRDNYFEFSTNLVDDPGWTYTVGHNAYITNCLGQMNTRASDLILSNDLAFETGPFGNFYQPSNSPLINAGSTTADQVGLFQYTVITNIIAGLEIKETNSVVDIGFHRVATDINGIPINTSGNGPDYLLDLNGNGLVDSGEIGWNIPGDLGLKVVITRPSGNSIIP